MADTDNRLQGKAGSIGLGTGRGDVLGRNKVPMAQKEARGRGNCGHQSVYHLDSLGAEQVSGRCDHVSQP